MKWLSKTIRKERKALERARRRFVRKATRRHLHDVRTTGRRLRSLLEDVADLTPSRRLLRRVKRAAAATDAARDATVVRILLENSVDAGELSRAQPLLDDLRRQERRATRRARSRLARAGFAG